MLALQGHRLRGGGLSLKRCLRLRSGPQRLLAYLRALFKRIQDSPYRVAAGAACGAAISFTPFIGFHLALAMLLAVVLRANLISAALGTAIGNPWTFPVIWLFTLRLGEWMLGIDGSLSVTEAFDGLADAPVEVLQPLVIPMIIGGFVLAIPAWGATYWLLRRLIARRRLVTA